MIRNLFGPRIRQRFTVSGTVKSARKTEVLALPLELMDLVRYVFSFYVLFLGFDPARLEDLVKMFAALWATLPATAPERHQLTAFDREHEQEAEPQAQTSNVVIEEVVILPPASIGGESSRLNEQAASQVGVGNLTEGQNVIDEAREEVGVEVQQSADNEADENKENQEVWYAEDFLDSERSSDTYEEEEEDDEE